MNTPLDNLIGKRIKQVFVDKDQQHWIRFVTDGEILDYAVDGDCCSESWIWAVSGLWYFVSQREEPKRVTEVREIELPLFIQETIAKDGLGRQEVDAVYSYFVQSEHGGGIEIEFRNSSNGYYGGEIHRAQAPETIRWVEIPTGYGCSYVADQKLNEEEVE